MFNRVQSWHDVQRISDGEIVGSIRATWDNPGGEIMANGVPAGACLRGAEPFGAVPAGVVDLFCGTYGEAAAAVRRQYRFVPDPGF